MSSGRPIDAVGVLVREHYAFLYRYAYRLSGSVQDAEDLTQQTFLAAQRAVSQLRLPENARAWLATILRNTYRRSFRTAAAGTGIPLDAVPEPMALPPEETPLDADELRAALAELPEEFRSALILYYLEQLGYREIAARLEVPIGTVMSRLSRGKAHLRRRLSQNVEAVAGGMLKRSSPD